MRNRTQLSGNFAFTRKVICLCEGHGGRDHQQIKGMLEPGLSRTEYARSNNSRLPKEIMRDLGAGIWLQSPGRPHGAAASDGGRQQRGVGYTATSLEEAAAGAGDSEEEAGEGGSEEDDDELFLETYATTKKQARANEKAKVTKAPAPKPEPKRVGRPSKTFCEGCLDPKGKAPHVSDDRCARWRVRRRRSGGMGRIGRKG